MNEDSRKWKCSAFGCQLPELFTSDSETHGNIPTMAKLVTIPRTGNYDIIATRRKAGMNILSAGAYCAVGSSHYTALK